MSNGAADHARVRQWDVLEVALDELDAVHAGLDRIAPRGIQHLGRHVQPDRAPTRGDATGRDQDVGPGAGAEVEDDLARVQVGDGSGHAAAQRRLAWTAAGVAPPTSSAS